MDYCYEMNFFYMVRSEKAPVWELAHHWHPAVLALTDSDKQVIRNGGFTSVFVRDGKAWTDYLDNPVHEQWFFVGSLLVPDDAVFPSWEAIS